MADARTLLLTRPRAQSRGLRRGAGASGCPAASAPVIAPLIEIVPLPAPLDLAGVAGAGLHLGERRRAVRRAHAPTASLPAWCVGEMTAAAARQAGFAARSADGDVAALAALIAAAQPAGRGRLPARPRARMPRATWSARAGGGRGAGARGGDLRPARRGR